MPASKKSRVCLYWLDALMAFDRSERSEEGVSGRECHIYLGMPGRRSNKDKGPEQGTYLASLNRKEADVAGV